MVTRAERALGAKPEAISEARALLDETLGEAGIERDRRFEALLVASELVTNAISHGSHPGDLITVEYRIDLVAGRLSIRVRDPARSRAIPVALTPDEQRPHGRGLGIVDRLAQWSEQMVDGHREVCAEVIL